jgi:hypothetical protein
MIIKITWHIETTDEFIVVDELNRQYLMFECPNEANGVCDCVAIRKTLICEIKLIR